MKTEDFYDVLDGELDELINNRIDPEIIGRYKQPQQKKSYAFLVWFLSFYAGIGAENSTMFITDGHQDNSCDIILGRTDSQGVRTFYLIQSKWNAKKNCQKEFETIELKSFLSDAQSILFGDKEETSNPVFNARYRELVAHVKANGRVKLLYLTLKNGSSQADENIASIKSAIGGTLEVEGIDINRLKRDYISKVYKKSVPPNPLERVYTPEEEDVEIQIVRNNKPNHIEIDKPFPAHVFTIRPKLIFNLVEKYGVSLFHRNIRNPLQNSMINADIERSLRDDPALFWYYNNGITAITKLIPSINTQAESFKVIGLQIINGAQTAYSIHRAYEKATPTKRKIIDNEARITFRLINSGSTDFDLKVTKFTNSQNPISQRDFWSNDDIQEQIQDYFYETNVWYERRSGEFQEAPETITVISNEIVAMSYLTFWLSEPIVLFESARRYDKEGVDLLFTSYKDEKDGLYEKIFHENINPQDVFAAFCMYSLVKNEPKLQLEATEDFSKVTIGSADRHGLDFWTLTISKLALSSYLKLKFGESINVSHYVSKAYQSDNTDVIRKCLMFSVKFLEKIVYRRSRNAQQVDAKAELLMENSLFAKNLMDSFSRKSIDVQEIESIQL